MDFEQVTESAEPPPSDTQLLWCVACERALSAHRVDDDSAVIIRCRNCGTLQHRRGAD